MIRRLKFKFVLLAMISLLILLTCIVAGMNAFNYNSVVTDADIMLDLIIGKPVEEAKRLSEIFLRMIKGKITEEEKEELEEAGILEDIAHMPARVKCAVLGWHTMEELLAEE